MSSSFSIIISAWLIPALLLQMLVVSVEAQLRWADTKSLFTFGDSYTSDGTSLSAASDSGRATSNGRTWVQYLGRTYNATDTRVSNLASLGATIDSELVAPTQPNASSLVDQVAFFEKQFGPAGAQWQSENTLFAVWIGMGDIQNSFNWTNVTQTQFYTTLMNRFNTQLESLHTLGARAFLILTIPPLDRTPYFLNQNPSWANSSVTTHLASLIDNFNGKLDATIDRFRAQNTDLDSVRVFDTGTLFNSLLNNADTLGYVNVTGWCREYEDGTGGENVQRGLCAPVSSYFWLDGMHPLWTVHDVLARAISTTLSAVTDSDACVLIFKVPGLS